MSTEERSSFEGQLQSVYTQYRNQSLESNLDDIAETMEETVLQRVLAEEFLQTEVTIDDEAKQAVREGRQLVNDKEYGDLGDRLDELERIVDDQERRVNNRIQEERIDMSTTVHGMIRLNERVERANEARLEAIKGLLDDWNWKEQVYRDENDGIETHKQHAAAYGRDMRHFFEDARDEIFGPYVGTPMEGIVDSLLDEDRLSLAGLTDEELEQLRDSDLTEYVGLRLS